MLVFTAFVVVCRYNHRISRLINCIIFWQLLCADHLLSNISPALARFYVPWSSCTWIFSTRGAGLRSADFRFFWENFQNFQILEKKHFFYLEGESGEFSKFFTFCRKCVFEKKNTFLTSKKIFFRSWENILDIISM